MYMQRPAGADAASLTLQAWQRGRAARQRLLSARAPAVDLDAECAAAALVRSLSPEGGSSFAYRQMDASGRSLRTLSALAQYPHLTSLDLSHNKLRSIAAVGALTRLVSLSVAHNLLVTVDLPAAPSLRRLDARCNAVRHVDGLGQRAHALEELILDGNNLSSLSGLSGLCQLRTLSAGRNRLSEVSELATAAPLLARLDLSRNRLEDVACLASMAALTTARLAHNRISQLPVLSRLRRLAELDVSHNELASLAALRDGLTGSPSLRRLAVEANPFSGVDASGEGMRLELLWLFPSLSELEGSPVEAVEKVRAQSRHSADADALLAIRRRHLPDEGLAASASEAARQPLQSEEDSPLVRAWVDVGA